MKLEKQQMKTYKEFLKLQNKYLNKVRWIVRLLEANGYAFANIDNVEYHENKVHIQTIGTWALYDKEYNGPDDYKSVNIPIEIFLGDEDKIKNFVKFKINQENLSKNPRNYKKFIDISIHLQNNMDEGLIISLFITSILTFLVGIIFGRKMKDFENDGL